ncbi:GspH/FimT family pseudopilin [Desulfuromonas sp. AOP6]|uniref:pilus assembly FimT family protein n=1 Tax=Desulfuromonas sp. AOP6 TaxID=1566351 RepID=UPI0012730400|nr:GspH/FimT family pseudopilin [Desulfuromonas sp. AOP6]BCA80226.1 hypothetical protein AOP6_2013 [Desulfuromonas sp. AOP6]
MISTGRKPRNAGFTLTELIVVIAMISVLMTIATPYYLDWLRNAKYREGAQAVTALLREARSRAIAEHREYRVVFNAAPDSPQAPSTMQLQGGNLSYNSSSWPIMETPVTLSENLDIRYRSSCAFNDDDQSVLFLPSGGASASSVVSTSGSDLGGICIIDGDSSITTLNDRKKLLIEMVSPTTGAFKVRKWNASSTSFQ